MSIFELRAYSMLTLGLTWQSIGTMTVKEVRICLKMAREIKQRDMTLVRDAHLNALINSKRTKKDKFVELFQNHKIVVKSAEDAKKEREEILAMRKRS